MKNELLLRTSKAIEFLCRMQKSDGSFISAFIKGKQSTDETKILYHLQATSLLYSCYNLLDQSYIKTAADKAVEYIESYVFEHNNESCIIYNGESYGYWNALLGLIYMKRQFGNYAPLIESIAKCFRDGKVVAQYIDGTQPAKFKNTMRGPVGAFVIAYLKSRRITDAIHSANHIMNSQRLDYLDTWALRLIYDELENDNLRVSLRNEYCNRSHVYIQMTSNIDVGMLTSYAAATTNQSLLSWVDIYPEVTGKCQELLNRQISFQPLDTFGGAFIQSDKTPDIRIEYIIHNTISFLEYLIRIEKTGNSDLSVVI